MLIFNFHPQHSENLCPHLQKRLLSSKISGYAHERTIILSALPISVIPSPLPPSHQPTNPHSYTMVIKIAQSTNHPMKNHGENKIEAISFITLFNTFLI